MTSSSKIPSPSLSSPSHCSTLGSTGISPSQPSERSLLRSAKPASQRSVTLPSSHEIAPLATTGKVRPSSTRPFWSLSTPSHSSGPTGGGGVYSQPSAGSPLTSV